VSGIYGVYRFDSAPVDIRWLEKMKAAMAYYGPDGGGSKIDDAVGMGHLLLEINPEDSFESQPVSGARGRVVSAARLDNRAALLDAFDVPSADARHLSDGHLVSLAFDRWGEEISSHLQGDWALAAWNRRERRLLLARDACGNATLYYYEGDGYIAFASSLKALLAIPGVVKEPDMLRISEVLVAWQQDAELTAYKGFRRLLWAHAMTVSAHGAIRTWQHWSPEGRAPLNYRRNEEYVQAFLEQYSRAVQSSLRTQRPVGAELSGGRDSGSVVALAAPLLVAQGRGLTAYTSVPCYPPDGATPNRVGNEWERAHATARMAGANVRHISIDAANYGVMQGIEYFLRVHDGPSHAAGNGYWLQAVAEAAAQNGDAVSLTGQMGNGTVSWKGNGSALLALLQGSPLTAWRLLLHAEPSLGLSLKRQVLKPLLTPALTALRRLEAPPDRFWKQYSALNTQLASELNLDARMRAAGHDAAFRFSPIADGRLPFFLGVFNIGVGLSAETAAMHSFSSVDPTVNLSLLEFLLRVPDDQFCLRGERSLLIRKAFRDRLPESVLSGAQTGLQAADVGHRVLRELPSFRECLNSLDSLPEARETLDLPLMRRCLDDLIVKVNPDTTQRANSILLRGLSVGLFLRNMADSQN
jgi:asparagine synthase (glutamine-hydrolysing)